MQLRYAAQPRLDAAEWPSITPQLIHMRVGLLCRRMIDGVLDSRSTTQRGVVAVH